MRGSDGWGGLVSKGNGGAPGLLCRLRGLHSSHFWPEGFDVELADGK